MKNTQKNSLIAAAILTSALSFQPTALAAPADFAGTWVNARPTTNGITRVNVTTNAAGALEVQVFGRCSPSDCDWGKASVLTYGANVSDANHWTATAVYSKGFANTILVMNLRGKTMTVQSLTQFTDGSNRQNYTTTEAFTKYR